MPEQTINPILSSGIVLQGKYRIEGHIASGGFGNTYVATHLTLDTRVAVKEFFMRGVNDRDEDGLTVNISNSAMRSLFDEQRRKFKKEARRIFQLDNPHIVKVLDLFEENSTSYYVMDFVNGESLSTIQKQQGHPFSEKEVDNILNQMLRALDTIHSRYIWHMDIKPGNILMDRYGKCVLIDFGSSKQTASSEGMTTSIALSYTPGYAPPEQINGSKERWGPWTDFYALGGTVYNLLTGERPPNSDVIQDLEEDAFAFPDHVSEKCRKLIIEMMNPSTKKRPQSVDEIRSLLDEDLSDDVEPVIMDEQKISLYSPMDEEKTLPAESIQQQVNLTLENDESSPDTEPVSSPDPILDSEPEYTTESETNQNIVPVVKPKKHKAFKVFLTAIVVAAIVIGAYWGGSHLFDFSEKKTKDNKKTAVADSMAKVSADSIAQVKMDSIAKVKKDSIAKAKADSIAKAKKAAKKVTPAPQPKPTKVQPKETQPVSTPKPKTDQIPASRPKPTPSPQPKQQYSFDDVL